MSTTKYRKTLKLIPETRIRNGFAGIIAIALFISGAHAQDETSGKELLLPEDLVVESNDKYQIEEVRIGNRLERLTLRRNNGFTEIYQNNSNDTIWNSYESELGDFGNVRQWKLGGW